MSLDTSEKIQDKRIGFLRIPKPSEDWRYISSILRSDEINNIPQEELFLCAYAQRVASGEKGDHVRMKYKEGYEHLDMAHYDSMQKQRWLPDKRWGAGVEFNHDPSDEDVAEFILTHQIISDKWRVFYAHKYPEKVKLRGGFDAKSLEKNLYFLLEKEKRYNEALARFTSS